MAEETVREAVGVFHDEATLQAAVDDLLISGFDRSWISADRDSIFYELDRGNGALSYAGSTIKDGVSTTIVGSGRCEAGPAPTR